MLNIPPPAEPAEPEVVHYAVRRVDADELVYAGTSVTAASLALMPGTTFGTGKTAYQARVMATHCANAASKVDWRMPRHLAVRLLRNNGRETDARD